LPPMARLVISQIIAVVVYWPLARLAALIERRAFSRCHSARVLPPSKILRDAHRCLRPVLYQARAAVHTAPD
jgi:hypothetical protein